MDGMSSIAIVGVGCKFPGADNLEEFWRVLVNGEDHVQAIPLERFNIDAFYDKNPDAPGKLYMKNAGLVKGFKEWDNHFYGIGDNEAKQIDPQQRFVLDCVHMAMEDGGITKKAVNETDTGVYIGMMNDDYKLALLGEDSLVSNYTVTGSNSSIISARVSYLYNLLGPSIVLDTACSSALVAIHMAASAIKTGDISMAVCGGVSCIFNPEVFVSLSKARMASPTGKCQAFSKHADGYARGEGCGIVILKRLDQALKDNNKIWGLIATECNQDGSTTSPITAPSPSQQVKLLEKVFSENQVQPSGVQYIEAHGTGTPVGDPIEANALGTFFSRHSDDNLKEIYIGSVKTNIGHLESAAGVAGLIKILLMMKNGRLVKSLHSTQLNSKIDFAKYRFVVPQKAIKWPQNTSRLACINSFGFGGTNCHAIVKEYVADESKQSVTTKKRHTIIAISANDIEALNLTMDHFVASLTTTKYNIEDIAYTSTVRRDHHRFRTFCICDSLTSLIDSLKLKITQLGNIQPIPLRAASVIFVFCGVGTAWEGMCSELMNVFPAFDDVVRRIDDLLRPLTEWSIYEILKTRQPVTHDPLTNHIGIFTCQVALFELWRTIGVIPKAIIGQSVGEVAAAYASGSLDLTQAVKVIYHRSKLLAEATGGSMAVIRGATIETVREECNRLRSGKATIAVYLSNECCTVSGDSDALNELKSTMEKKKNVRVAALNVKCAYHSHFTEVSGRKLGNELSGLKPNHPAVAVFSSVTGKQANNDNYASPTYWSSNVSDPVLFRQAIEESESIEIQPLYVEIGPSPVLRAHISSIFPGKSYESFPSMKRGNEIQTYLETVGHLYSFGCELKWENLIKEGHLADIPTYSFNKKVLFEESPSREMKRSLNLDTKVSQMLLDQVPQSKENTFSLILDEKRTGFIYEHLVDGSVIIPGALYGEVGLEVGKICLGLGARYSVSWKIHNPLAMSAGQISTLQVKYIRTEDSTSFTVSEKDNQLLSSGKISRIVTSDTVLAIDNHISSLKRKPKDDAIYKILRKFGFSHGPVYQVIQKGIYEKDECFAEMMLSDNHLKMQQSTVLHPVIIDGMLQCCCSFLNFHEIPSNAKIFPVGIGYMSCSQAVTKKMYIYAKLMEKDGTNFACNAVLLQENGIIVAELQNIKTRLLNFEADIRRFSYSYNLGIMEPFEKTSLKKTNKFITLSWSEHIGELLKPDLSFRPIHLDDKDDMESNVALVERLIFPGATIVYIPGYKIHDGDDTDVTYSKILRSAKMMLHLIKLTSNINSRTVVVTEAIQNMNKQDQKVNLLGSELWGLVRSAAMEPTKSSFYLIDTSPSVEESLPTLKQALNIAGDEKGELPFETCIVDNVVSYGFISNAPKYESRISSGSVGNTFHGHCKDDNVGCKTYNVFKQEQHKSSVTIEINTVCNCLLSSEESMTLSSSKSVSKLWNTSYPMSEENVLRDVVEVIGRSGSSSKQRKTNKRNEVICCYPFINKPDVMLPKRHTCSKDDIPHYIPGMFQSCILAMYIADAVLGHQHVGIVADEKFSGVLRILEIMSEEKKVVLTSFPDLKQSDLPEEPISCLVLLTTVKNKNATRRPDILYRVSKLLCLEDSLEGIAANENPSVIEIIGKSDVYGYESITKRFTKAKSFLKRHSKSKLLQNVTFGTIEQLRRGNKLPISRNRKTDSGIVRKKSSYVVVGGYTGLGWLIVKYLANNGASKIVILSRRTPDEKTTLKLQNLRSVCSVYIVTVQVNICDKLGLTKTFSELVSLCKNEPIRGIFHGAAVTADSFASGMSMEQFEAAIKPKVLGTLNLDLVSRGLDLDFFTMHSSVAALLGNAGQCNYSSGNSFEDGMALYRRSLGLPAQSIIWGALDVGLASDALTKDALKSKGFIPLTSHQIVSCFDNSLRSQEVHPCYINIDWSSFLQMDIKSQILKFKNYLMFTPEYNLSAAEAIPSLSTDDSDHIQETVLHCIASVFALPPSQISHTCPVIDLGLDSQKGTELASLLFEKLQVRVPYIYLATGDHTACDIAQYIVNRLEKQSFDVDATNKAKPAKEGSVNRWDKFVFEFLLSSRHLEYKQIHLQLQCLVLDGENLSYKFQSLNLLHESFRSEFKYQTDAHGNQTITKHVVDTIDSVLSVEVLQMETIPEDLLKRKSGDASFKIIVLKKAQHTSVVLMFCPLLFDSQSITLICKHAIRILETKPNTSVRLLPQEDSLEYSNLVKLDDKKAQNHWKDVLTRQKCVPLHNIERKISINTKHRYFQEIPGMVVSAVAKEAQKLGLTLYQAICSFVQTALHKLTGLSQITILAQTDMRTQLGIDESTPGMFSNIIPLVADFSNKNGDSFSEFIHRNAYSFNLFREENLFPFHEIRRLPDYDSFRHELLLCSFLDESNICRGRGNDARVTSYTSGFSSISNLELLIVYSERNLGFYLSGMPQCPVSFSGSVLLGVVGHLMTTFVSDPNESFELALKSIRGDNPKGHTTAGLYSRKKMGEESRVEPKFTKSRGQGRFLILGKTKIKVSNITEVTKNGHKGQHCVEIRTKKKAHIFFAYDSNACEIWAAYITDSLNPVPQKGLHYGSMSSLCSPMSFDNEIDDVESTHL